jgi:chromosome segregation ATPase
MRKQEMVLEQPSSIHPDQYSEIQLDTSWRMSFDERVNDLKNEVSKLKAQNAELVEHKTFLEEALAAEKDDNDSLEAEAGFMKEKLEENSRELA